jgi:hypothetical protein
MQALALLSLLLAPFVIAGPIYPICSLENTNGEYFLTGPTFWPGATLACATAGAVLASIYEHTKDDAAMQEYLDLRRGMRACNNTVRAWVNDKSQIKAADTGVIPPPIRILTITGMVDGQIEDITNEYMALCQFPA